MDRCRDAQRRALCGLVALPIDNPGVLWCGAGFGSTANGIMDENTDIAFSG